MSDRFKPPGQCPVCGEWVPRGAAACDDCGACAKSGWSGDTHADGLDLPDDEFGGKSSKQPLNTNLWWWVALALLLILVVGALLPVFR